MKTIITFCSIWAFLGYKWAQCQRVRGHSLGQNYFFKSLLLRARCWRNSFGRSSFQTHVFIALVSLFILSDNFFDLGPIFKWIDWLSDAELYTEKDLLKEIKYSRSSPDPENYWCGHQQSYHIFSVFVDFRTLPDSSGKPKSVDSK